MYRIDEIQEFEGALRIGNLKHIAVSHPPHLQGFAYCLSSVRSVTLAKLRKADLRPWTDQP